MESQVENGLVEPGETGSGALVAWLPNGLPFHEWEDEPMVRTYAVQHQQPNGDTVFTHFQVYSRHSHHP
jgi:hypothetical protein